MPAFTIRQIEASLSSPPSLDQFAQAVRVEATDNGISKLDADYLARAAHAMAFGQIRTNEDSVLFDVHGYCDAEGMSITVTRGEPPTATGFSAPDPSELQKVGN